MSHYNLAVTYIEQGRPDLTLKHHWLASQQATEGQITLMANMMKELENAESALPEGMTIQQRIENIDRFEEANILMHSNDFTGAIAKLEEIVKHQHQLVPVIGHLGICHISLKNFEAAEQYLKAALEIDAEYIPVLTNLDHLEKIKEGELKKLPVLRITQFLPNRDAVMPTRLF